MLVVSGALGAGELSAGLAIIESLSRVLEPAAYVVERGAWSATWRFYDAALTDDSHVDADSILPALAAVISLSAPSPLTLAFGVLTPQGEYVPLAFRASSLAGAANEADVNAADLRSRYRRLGDSRPDDDEYSYWRTVEPIYDYD